MKKIIVATDFSNNADVALLYAMHLFRYFDLRLHILHVYKLPHKSSMLVSIDSKLEEEISQKMEKRINMAKEHYMDVADKISYSVVEGDLIEVIQLASEQMQVDHIVMGLQGDHFDYNLFMGSTAKKVIRQTSLPVLFIPSRYEFREIRNILFAVKSYSIDDPAIVEPLLGLLRKFQSTVEVVKLIDKPEDNEEINLHLDHAIYSVKEIETANIYKEIEKYLSTDKFDMLVARRRSRGFISKIIESKNISRDDFYCDIPFFVLGKEEG